MSSPPEPAHEAAQKPDTRDGSDTSDDSTLTDDTQTGSDESKSSTTLTDTIPPSEQYTRANGSYSAHPPRRGRRGNGRRPSATRRLGAIDEQSNAVHPDVPLRNPRRTIPGVKFFNLGSSQNYSHSSNDLPDYDNVTGPRGEKFADLRANKTGTVHWGRGGKRKWLCVALAVVIILGIALGVGLGVGLTREKSHNSPASPSSTSTPQSSPAPFPVGKWAITASLLTINTSCTSNTAAFNCYPYTTHAQSASGSTTSLLWDITSPLNSTSALYISSSNPTLSYPFQNTPLTPVDTSNLLAESYTFSSTFTKSVIPQSSITSNGENAICYFNGTVLTARLFATAAGAGGIGNATGSAGASVGGTDMDPDVEQPWPYALEYSESVTSSPECYEYVNGTVGQRIQLSGAANGECGCQYQNYVL